MSVFDDARAQKLLTADAGEIAGLASQFHQVAETAALAAGALRSAQDTQDWTGAAADSFRSSLGPLPGDLDNVNKSYAGVVSALRTYESAMTPLQSRFKSLKTQWDDAQAKLSSAQSAAGSANHALQNALFPPLSLPAPLVPPPPAPGQPSLSDLQTAADHANTALTNAQNHVNALEHQAGQILDEFDGVRGTARSGVSAARGPAPNPPHVGFWGHVGNFFKGVGEGAWGIVKGVGEAAYHLPGDVANVIEHPTNLDDWAKLGEDTATVASAVAVVAAIAACPADAALVGEVASVADTTAVAATGVKTAADTGLAVEGKGSWGTVAEDAASLGMSKIEPGAKGAEEGVSEAKNASDGLEQYGLNRSLGAGRDEALSALSPAQREGLESALKDDQSSISQYDLNKALGASPSEAFGALTKEQQAKLTDAYTKLSNPAGVTEMRSSASQAVTSAEKHAGTVEHANIAGHGAADLVKSHYQPEYGHKEGAE